MNANSAYKMNSEQWTLPYRFPPHLNQRRSHFIYVNTANVQRDVPVYSIELCFAFVSAHCHTRGSQQHTVNEESESERECVTDTVKNEKFTSAFWMVRRTEETQNSKWPAMLNLLLKLTILCFLKDTPTTVNVSHFLNGPFCWCLLALNRHKHERNAIYEIVCYYTRKYMNYLLLWNGLETATRREQHIVCFIHWSRPCVGGL